MEDQELTLSPADYSLLTDLYQLTMAACYVGEGVDQRRASFELFARRLPNGFGYLIAMGLAQALDYLENFRFHPSQIEALQSTGIFVNAPNRFWELLAEAKFTGDIWAVPEGTVVFANEPLLRVEAPLWQAQLVETYLLNTINYQTLIATKTARIRDIAGEQATLLEFGTRRAFSPQASLWAARAAIAAGMNATSNVLAAMRLDRQPSGTMAHALVMALASLQGDEDEAFVAFHRYFPGAVLLIDTYDSVAAARRLAEQVNGGQLQLKGVRLDSGDLVTLSQQVRSLLPNVAIVASGDLDEYEILRLQQAGAAIDAYGIGTKLVTGAPVNGVYKLVEIDGIPVMKESSGKITRPGRKQIFRQTQNGQLQSEQLGLLTDAPKGYEPLLQLVYKQGERLQEPEPLAAIAHRTAASVATLPESVRRLDYPSGETASHRPDLFTLEITPALQELTDRTQRNLHPSYTEQNLSVRSRGVGE